MPQKVAKGQVATPLDCALGLPFVTYGLGDRAEVCVGLGTDLDLSYGGGCAELVCCSCLLARGGAPPGRPSRAPVVVPIMSISSSCSRILPHVSRWNRVSVAKPWLLHTGSTVRVKGGRRSCNQKSSLKILGKHKCPQLNEFRT